MRGEALWREFGLEEVPSREDADGESLELEESGAGPEPATHELVASTGEGQPEVLGRSGAAKLRIALSNSLLVVRDGRPALLPSTHFAFVGSIGSAYSRQGLDEAGITHILCLSSSIRLKFIDDFSYLRLPLVDSSAYPLVDVLDNALAFIEAARDAGGRVLVHCYQGRSRAVAVCCAFLMKTNGWGAARALDAVRSVRPCAQPNAGFLAALRQFERALGVRSGNPDASDVYAEASS